ncbi:hypothetical protein [Ancylomarina longa]|uniref:PLD phosphodiesterase domain-containing protein n=1 Tax=Ancylomarina longa TaxID=2487017 RepID=A0A434AWQ8_9BACT|nr:hypothetical protein [Ancylomarina longa]RUT78951.1 hypothetical protein DLK05_05570 [Ancylomarina longa]
MEEKKIYIEVPGGRNKFHSAILTSFSFNFHHFEYQVLKTLKHKWVTNVGVLVDSDMLDNSIGLTSGGLRQLTQSYSVNGVKAKGAFHPKINFFIGDKEILMVMGSGNITPGGHGKNHETFTTFYADSKDSPFLPLLIETWQYIQYLSTGIEGYSKERIINIIPRNCDLLSESTIQPHSFVKVDDQTEIALVYNSVSSAFSQLLRLLPQDSIRLISIVCPYFDEGGDFLLNLLDKLPNATMQVYIPEEFGLPPTNMAENDRASFFAWENTKRGEKDLNGGTEFKRKLHSKIFNFKSDENEYCLIGSANATMAAWGTESNKGINEEFGALYKSKKLNFLDDLGIKGVKKVVKPSAYKRESKAGQEVELKERKERQIRILSCDLNVLTLKIFLKQELSHPDMSVVLCNDVGTVVYKQSLVEVDSKEIFVRLNSECLSLNPAYVIFENDKGDAVSNKQVLNYLDKLYHTDPSKENRTIRGLIGALEIGKVNEFQIMNYLTELDSSKALENKNHSSGNRTFSVQDVHGEVTYEEAVAASKNKDVKAKLFQTHNTIRIWQTLTQLFNEQHSSNIEELNDEEEDGSANVSVERKATIRDFDSHEIKDKSEANRILRRTAKLSLDFEKAMEKNQFDNEFKINEVTVCQFLVVSHVITAILCFTNYTLPYNQSKKEYKLYDPNEWKDTLREHYHSIMQKVLLAFSRVVISCQLEDYSSDEYKDNKLREYLQKAVDHSIICNYLINGNRMGNPHSDMSDLACLNILKKFGKTDENFRDYVEAISKSNLDVYFNYLSVIRLNKRLNEEFLHIDENEKIFYHEQNGVCLIKEKHSSNIKYKCIQFPMQILEYSLTKLKKKKPVSNQKNTQ